MGWCSGTRVFDDVCKALLDKKEPSVKDAIKTIIIAFEENDWDCQEDSNYIDHPIVRAAFEEIHPGFFREEE